MADPARRKASYDDLLGLPDNVIGEIIDGELVTQPRPGTSHAVATSVLAGELSGPFHRGKGGPGGWVILFEPELHLGPDVVVPDLAGWRRERMPVIPDAPAIEQAPDWACEVLSPSTEAVDRVKKTRLYAREHVGHVWLVNPAMCILEVLELDGETYRIRAVHDGNASVRAAPFDAMQLDLGALWAR